MNVKRSSITDTETHSRRSTELSQTNRTKKVLSRVSRSATSASINSLQQGFLVIPVAGFVQLSKQIKKESTESYGIRRAQKNLVSLTEENISELNQYQKKANAMGFIVTMTCPRDGEVVKTRRTGDLESNEAAYCERCKKRWIIKD
jgi:hypothetical protein